MSLNRLNFSKKNICILRDITDAEPWISTRRNEFSLVVKIVLIIIHFELDKTKVS